MKSVYEQIGEEKLAQLVEVFYRNVQQDEQLLQIFPGDWEETARKQTLFLTQYFGGPSRYSMERGHPMLRRRHLPFPITPSLAERWLHNMAEAMDEVGIDDYLREGIFHQLRLTAYHMVNTEES